MATPHLLVDLFDSEAQAINDRMEFAIYGRTGGLATDHEIQRKYVSGFRGPFISTLIDDAMKDERWHLGRTMTELAENLGTDHATISRALRWGIFPSELETYLLSNPNKPDDWEVPIKAVFGMRHRAGIMTVADHLRQRQPGISRPLAEPLNELHSEFIFTLWDHRQTWKQARLTRDSGLIRAIVRSVVDDPSREVIPFWYDKKRRQQLTKLIERLQTEDVFALRWLCLLEARWQDVFVTAEIATEGLGWLKRSAALPIWFGEARSSSARNDKT